MKKARRLTIYLMREDVQEFDDALEESKPGIAVAVDNATGIDGRFYYVVPILRPPDWVSYVRPILGDHLADLRSASTSALLMIRTSGRIFALTFGYGRSLLNLSKIEYQFGLRVALNRIDPRQLRSLDTKTFEDMVVTTNTQVSQSAELPAFDINISTDILRAATGSPRDSTITRHISGSDALVVNVKTPPTELPALCDDLLVAFGEQTYKSDFGWIDQLALVRESEQTAALNALLVSDLVNGITATTHLAVPEAISWEDIESFKIAGTRDQIYDDLDLETYLKDLGDSRGSLTIELLKSRRVSVRFGRSETFDSRWNLYRCLVSEQRLDDRLYVLIEGRWFAVDRSLVDEVDAFANGLPSAKAVLIPARAGEHEKHYNDRLTKSSPEHFLMLDAQIKRPGGAASGIELCDVLSDQGEFIHVKRKSRSSTLSHLFAQGSVSATTFIRDGQFREEVRAHIRKTVPSDQQDRWLAVVPGKDDHVAQQDYRVTYVVVVNSRKDGADWLPFFSKLNLMQHGRQLIGMGMEVAISRVQPD